MGTSKTENDRPRGALIGLAVGDALGAAVEFQMPGSFKPVTGYRAGGPHGLSPGEWTDDSSMALALADSIAEVGWDLNDQAQRYVAWWRTGKYSVNGRCFDIGTTTARALGRFQKSGDASTSGDPSPEASGNGSIMRLAPVPIRYGDLMDDRLEELISVLTESSVPTHPSEQCLSACAYMGILLAGLMQGLDRETVLSPTWKPLAHLREIRPLHPEIEEIANGSFRTRTPPEIVGSGYVVKSLEAALWAFQDAQDFRKAVLRAVNLGDDADTTGAVCGQLAGAFWGESGIPKEWLEGLARRDMIESALDGLLGRQAVSPKVHPELFPKEPAFLTSNRVHRQENEAAVAKALQLAVKGDLEALKSMPLPPSPKIVEWHGQLVRVVASQIEVPVDQAAVTTYQLATPDAAPPTKSSYWVVPHLLLAGAYPGDPDKVKHREKIQVILDSGVRACISLMEENETNHQGDPFVPYEGLAQEICHDVVCARYPIKDLTVPSPGQMAAVLDAIDEHLQTGNTVYVHCWGGVGRTGTVIGCWLLRRGLAKPEDVIQVLKRLRKQDQERGHRNSPETSEQEEFVRNWREAADGNHHSQS